MDNHPIGNLMEVTMQKIREMVDVNTIVGQPISTLDGITLIPVSKVSFGFGSGGSDFQAKSQPADKNFGGGVGAGVKIAPVAFLVIKDGNAKILNINPPATSTVDRLVELAPDIIDKVAEFINKGKE